MQSEETVDGSLEGDRALDPRMIESLRALGERGGEDLLGRLAELFIERAPDRMVTLRRAFGDGETAALGRLAHGLRGSAGALGADRLSQLCAHIEGDGGSDAELDEVELEMYRTCAALGAFVASA